MDTSTPHGLSEPKREFRQLPKAVLLRHCDSRGVSFALNLLEAASGLGRIRDLAKHLASIELTPATQLEPSASGWLFCSGGKRGWKVGKNRAGKGTKWMVVVDGEGIPSGKAVLRSVPAPCGSRGRNTRIEESS